MEYKVTEAKLDELNEIVDVYREAKKFMVDNGNNNQWINGYPSLELLKEDINNHQLFVLRNEKEVCGVFAFIIGEDPTYKVIDGAWMDDSLYGTIHRAGGKTKYKNILKNIVAFCETKINHLRIDTHEDNKIMQHVILKNGFNRCGIIYISDGSPRIAYEKI